VTARNVAFVAITSAYIGFWIWVSWSWIVSAVHDGDYGRLITLAIPIAIGLVVAVLMPMPEQQGRGTWRWMFLLALVLIVVLAVIAFIGIALMVPATGPASLR
jgi:hypothetical protein